jgi:hypothetical protein
VKRLIADAADHKKASRGLNHRKFLAQRLLK